MLRHLIFGCLFVLLAGTAAAQTTASLNPFDLRYRLPKVVIPADSVVVENIPEAVTNPFDVVVHRPPGVSKTMLEDVAEPFEPATLLPRGDTMPKQGIFWVLTALLGVLSVSIAANRTAVGRAWRGFLNENGLTLAQREASGLVGNTPYFLLYASFLLNSGVFIFLVTRVFAGGEYNNLRFLALCMLVASAMFLAKHLFVAALGGLFPVAAEVRRYSFLIMVFNCVLGLFLLPFNALMAFAGQGEEVKQFIAFWMISLVGLFYAYRAWRSGRIARKFLAADQFHFLLYLCTVEIAPVLILVKIALRQAS